MCHNPAGVGRVRNVRFDQLFTAVIWDPPLTAGILDSLHYRVIVVNNDTGVVIVSNTTTVTIQPLPDVQLCHFYIADVTAFSSEYHGDSVVTGERSPGGTCVCTYACVQVLVHKMISLFRFTIHLEYYRVSSSSQNVGFAMSCTVVFSIGLNLKVQRYIAIMLL